MATTETIRDNLAFIAEFGQWARGAHYRTRVDAFLKGLVRTTTADELEASGFRVFEELTEEGRALAATSPLAKCFSWLRENGYQHDTRSGRRRSGSFIMYGKFNELGESVATAFISSWTYVYAAPKGQIGSTMAFDGRK